MFRPPALFIGLRYTRAKRRNHFISFISLTSIAGIALGIAALITVLSVMNGFEKEIRQRILGMTSHATISDFNSRLLDWQGLTEKVEDHPEVVGTAPYVRAQAMLINGQQVSGSIVRGVRPDLEPRVSDVGDHMKVGALDDLRAGGWGIVLGQALATTLGVGVGDKVTLITPQASVTPAGILPRLRRLTVVALFEVGMYEYDRATAFIHIGDAKKLFQMDGAVSGLRLKLTDLFTAPRISRDLMTSLNGEYWVSDWTKQHANYFRAVRTEKTVMFVILTLIVAVAAFNIVSTLVMTVTDKQADIAILRTLGLTPRSVMAVFMVQGTIIGLFGALIGVVGGVALALNVESIVPFIEGLIGRKFLDPGVYYISDLPSDLHIIDVAKIALLAFVLTVLATIYPAWRAARTQPAEALRYE